ncbi:zinc ABC transporter substrate-binding protein AztC [soil metagenome]
MDGRSAWARGAATIGALVLALSACGEEDGPTAAGDDGPLLVVTTNILGDVVENLVADGATVEVILPANADPHDFEASAQQVETMGRADLLITNGFGFEAGLLDVIESVESDGVEVYAAGDAVEPLKLTGPADEDEGHEDEDADHGDEEGHEDEDDHGGEDADPHWFTDPGRMAVAADALAAHLVEHVPGVAAGQVEAHAADYVAELEAVDAELAERLGDVPEENRQLVTNHEVFGYFADAYGFEVVGTVIPGGSTSAEPSAADLADLTEILERTGAPAIFAETSSPASLADALADEAGVDVEVVELFSESLGEEGSGGATYLEMMRTNGERVADALGA